ncbi:hypothetical protein J7T55_005218 [Diaporthe amygdali]|uniref:uncharacterized protein n=1 Tax=Phomopsis amygdali TaxID=1214568 RepID=UPI0022FE260C|nr:uncharacterized protein J7T55_005218 [Diaporthe amygdali]KAJ0116272.1 hypothetical protein J7T55_005218 [Diaporthe amygdali]
MKTSTALRRATLPFWARTFGRPNSPTLAAQPSRASLKVPVATARLHSLSGYKLRASSRPENLSVVAVSASPSPTAEGRQRKSKMRIGCLQFAPQVGDVDGNLSRADAALSRADPDDLDSLDLLVVPEMAFSGYNFTSLSQIIPFLEYAGTGISSLWARSRALKHNCHVVVGFPEQVDVSDKWPTSPEYYNSAIVVSNEGETIATYRKHFLYMIDETWALEGSGFGKEYIPGLGQTAMGICMDINPYKFEAPWHAFEFAFHVLEVRANLVILSMAWLTREDVATFTSKPDEPDMETLTYWVQRMEPIIRAENDEEIVFVFCNRCGIEGDTVYAGTSTVISIKQGECRVHGLLPRGRESLLVVDTDDPPLGKLISRVDTELDSDASPEDVSVPTASEDGALPNGSPHTG